MLQLNFGSGTTRVQDFISVDLYAPEADMGLDLTRPLPYEDEMVDNIYSSHLIEHLSRAEWELARTEWARVLKTGGTIEIRCPNIVLVCERFLRDPNSERLMQQLYGLQTTEGEFHKNGFTRESLEASFPTLKAELLAPSTSTELHMRFTK